MLTSKDSQWPDGERGLRRLAEEKTLLLRTVRVERKEVTLALKENHLGRFLKVTEEAGGHYNRIIIPTAGLAELKQALEDVIRVEGEQARSGGKAGVVPSDAAKASLQHRVKEGDVIAYNDGRPGHCGVKAAVLDVQATGMMVQFEDRADTTFISFADRKWMEFIDLPGTA